MREIKFRAIGLDKKWYFGDLRHNGSSMRIEWETTDWNAHPPLGTIIKHGVNVKKETVGQYTGLKDKNGKEIYEGDVVKGQWWACGKSHRHIGVVTYVMNAFKVRGAKQYIGIDDELNSSYEVIGNIYDNPELLNQ
ncbi:YopX family protein [Bacillus testis]|uniref:YopX family protein n=1 Tax=Bacillus testis TaxID=1622072 RepID=UPI00067E8FBB|nr:YopX family protein [Bacillus testis]